MSQFSLSYGQPQQDLEYFDTLDEAIAWARRHKKPWFQIWDDTNDWEAYVEPPPEEEQLRRGCGCWAGEGHAADCSLMTAGPDLYADPGDVTASWYGDDY